MMADIKVKILLWSPRLKYKVNAIDPKYVAVNGRRGVDVRWFK